MRQFIPHPSQPDRTSNELQKRAAEFYQFMAKRRTVRDFSDEPVPRDVIEHCLSTAGTAPSGANLQPWQFVAVSDPEVKRQIRLAAEAEEQEFYHQIAPESWLKELEPIGTDEHKPFLEKAPWLIAVFAKKFDEDEEGNRRKHYYVSESVGIATGMLITAIHQAGLASLTHTPSPMRFLNDILQRPARERPFLLLVVGKPAKDALVPDIHRKPLVDIARFIEK